VDCKNCGTRLKSRRRYFREITKLSFRICDVCEKAQPHSLEFDPPSGANIKEAALFYEKFRSLLQTVSLRILVWGPEPGSDNPASRKRKEVRIALEKLGHKVFFSEELVFDKTYRISSNSQERQQIESMDAVICIASDYGPLQELQEFGLKAKEFLGWLSSEARGKYTDSGIAQQLRRAKRDPLFFNDEDLSTCVIAAASTEWVEGHRAAIMEMEQEQERLARILKRRRGAE